MADLANFTMTRNGSATASVPRFDVVCDLVDSTSGQLIKSVSGTFPNANFVSKFSSQEIEDAFRNMIMGLIQLRAAEV